MSKVEAIPYGDRKVYAVAAFNRGVAEWLQRLPTVWVEGEVTELRRNARWQSVFFTLKDPNDGACLGEDRKSTRLNSSHVEISYAVFCLKKKTKNDIFFCYKKKHKTNIK